MKELIPKNEYGLFADKKDIVRVDSWYVAELFEKNHNEVVRDIRNIVAPNSGLSKEFTERNFALGSYKDK